MQLLCLTVGRKDDEVLGLWVVADSGMRWLPVAGESGVVFFCFVLMSKMDPKNNFILDSNHKPDSFSCWPSSLIPGHGSRVVAEGTQFLEPGRSVKARETDLRAQLCPAVSPLQPGHMGRFRPAATGQQGQGRRGLCFDLLVCFC